MAMYRTVPVPPVINKQKVKEKNLFLFVSLKPLKKSAGIGSRSVIKWGGSVSKLHESGGHC
jgi:hypothetical protein